MNFSSLIFESDERILRIKKLWYYKIDSKKNSKDRRRTYFSQVGSKLKRSNNSSLARKIAFFVVAISCGNSLKKLLYAFVSNAMVYFKYSSVLAYFSYYEFFLKIVLCWLYMKSAPLDLLNWRQYHLKPFVYSCKLLWHYIHIGIEGVVEKAWIYTHRYAARAAKALRWRLKQLLKYLKKIIPFV